MEIVPWTYNNPRVDRHKVAKQGFLFQGVVLDVLQDTEAEIDVTQNTQLKLWDGAYLLARHLENTEVFPRGYWSGKRCIELGAGCGLVGQVAWLLGADVTLSDLDVALPHTQKCLEANSAKVPACVSSLRACPYAWGEGTERVSAPYDVILGSDVIYEPRLAKVFVKALSELSGPNTLILLSYKPRALGEAITFDLIKRKGFSIDTVPKAQHPNDYLDSGYDLLRVSRAEG